MDTPYKKSSRMERKERKKGKDNVYNQKYIRRVLDKQTKAQLKNQPDLLNASNKK